MSAPTPPLWLKDQLDAAGRDAARLLTSAQAALVTIEPDRDWRTVAPLGDRAAEVSAFVAAAIAGSRLCPHLRWPQLAIARLALDRVDCAACANQWQWPPAGDDHRCDWCGRSPVHRFSPIWLAVGPLVAVGDACGTCAAALSNPQHELEGSGDVGGSTEPPPLGAATPATPATPGRADEEVSE